MPYKGTSKWQGQFTIGQRFGNWTVKNNDVIIDHEAKLLCHCDCGFENYISVLTLVKGISTQCFNCGNNPNTKLGNKNPKWKGIGVVPGSYLNRGKKLSPEIKQYAAELIEQQQFKCALTGLPVSFEKNTASLDRIDSNRGYVKDNLQWIHKAVNIMKNAYPQTYFISMCHQIAKTNSNPDIDLLKECKEYKFGNNKKRISNLPN